MILYILQCVCGFLLQIVLCTFFCVYPFDGNFRYSRIKFISACSGILAVMGILFTSVYIKIEVPTAENVSYFPLKIIFSAAVVLLMLLHHFFIKAPTTHKLFVFFIIMNYGFLVREAAAYLWKLFPASYDNYMYSPRTLIFHLLVNGILFCPMLDLMHYMQKVFSSPIPEKTWRNLIMIPAVFILTLLICYELPGATAMSITPVLRVFVKAIGVFMLFLCYWIFRVLEQ